MRTALWISLTFLLLTAATLPACKQKTRPASQQQGMTVGVTSTPEGEDAEVANGQALDYSKPRKLIALFSASAADPWTAGVINTLGAELAIDPWSEADLSGNVVTFGPHPVHIGEFSVFLTIGLIDMERDKTHATQVALGAEMLAWLQAETPDLVWLDGDKAQYHAGTALAASIPVVYTGVTLEHRLYYDAAANATGVQERHSVNAGLTELLRQDREAKLIALVSGDSPYSRGRVAEYLALGDVLPEGMSFSSQPPVESWDELRDLLLKLQFSVDAVLFCGLDEDGAAPGLLNTPCPDNLLHEIGLATVALGPTRLEQAGVTSLRIKPSAHARAGLEYVATVLGGTPTLLIPLSVPEDMERFKIVLD